mmetsp:Transcript_1747/g.6228  ORF Transcript_1747/g.6228 Transcript_1747/m.6228 type:complete len:287 (-) Transcript_1747:90-950(-)|eukprot:CAMPEP_0114631498 /NCGR_PEP_ID=MMETSP0168-20121206/14444_1 /TAXON_ID=95228 ORGANISM="Vannella sp., Strain DIVA3 517/6/12" /NCGR_SAMPLE_ID=MMETSP0168 /ASSEMBLY_ACC=CAM_ASM_000044 /LENGTH=286 /DNA_ID=CAMNT_0001843067 /DNA_START=121 /DNA_END=981 /DNA_ORIENTATION=-
MSTTVFGEPLETVMARPDENKVPKMLQHTLGWLNQKAIGTEGLFRVSAGVKQLDNLKGRFNKGELVPLDEFDLHLVAGLLKAYFIELPEPLLTFDLYDAFIEAADTPDCKEKLKKIFARLPEPNKWTAACLFKFLSNVALQSSENKMTTTNLAIVFGQIVLRPKVESLESLLRHSPKITSLLKTIVENYDDIIPANKDEAAMISKMVTPAGMKKEEEEGGLLTPEQQKLRNIKVTVEDAITAVLSRLDVMAAELNSSTSLEETIEIAKRVRTAKRIICDLESSKAA